MTAVPLLHYQIRGNGPTIVLLHGFLASSRYWHKLADLLARNYRVVTIDLLGFGASPKPRRSAYDYDAHLASIRATLDDAGINRPFVLVGHSMGALLALRLTGQSSGRVRGLVLANMPILLAPQQARREFYGTSLSYRFGLMPIINRMVWRGFRLAATWRLLPRKTADYTGDHYSYLFNHTAVSRMRSFRNVIVNAKTQADLQALRVETLLVSGLSDRPVYFENLPHLSLGRHVRVKNLEGEHHLPQTQPEVFYELIAEVAQRS